MLRTVNVPAVRVAASMDTAGRAPNTATMAAGAAPAQAQVEDLPVPEDLLLPEVGTWAP